MQTNVNSVSTEQFVLTAEQKLALIEAKVERVRAEMAALAELAVLLKRQDIR